MKVARPVRKGADGKSAPVTRGNSPAAYLTQNEVARRADISSAHLLGIMTARATPSGEVLKRLHGVLFQRTKAEERVAPAEVKVLAWKKGGRNGVVVRGAGGLGVVARLAAAPLGSAARVPWGAEVECAYRAGYDSRGRVSVTHLVDERGYSAMLTQPEAGWRPAQRPRRQLRWTPLVGQDRGRIK